MVLVKKTIYLSAIAAQRQDRKRIGRHYSLIGAGHTYDLPHSWARFRRYEWLTARGIKS